MLVYQDSRKLCGSLNSVLFGVPFGNYSTNQGISTETEGRNCENTISDSVQTVEKSTNLESSNGRVMLIDGTSVIYRAYFRLLGTSPNLAYFVFMHILKF